VQGHQQTTTVTNSSWSLEEHAGYLNYDVFQTNADSLWEPQNSGTVYNLNEIFAINEDRLFIVGNQGTILKTTDGGSHWVAKNSGTTRDLYSVFFTDSLTGYAVGSAPVYDTSYIIKTIDGGASWQQINPGNCGRVMDVFFTNDSTGYVVGGEGLGSLYTNIVYKTTDRGNHWSLQHGGGIYYNSVSFCDANHGIIVGIDYDWGAGYSARTHNAGVNWVQQSNSNRFYGVDCVTPALAFAAGYSGISISSDSGATWSLSLTGDFRDVDFIDGNNGIAAGMDGILFSTLNGGNSWNVEISATSADLTDVCFVTSNCAYVVGTAGTILKNSMIISGAKQTSVTEPWFQLFPNPVTGSAMIQYPEFVTGDKITVTDRTGRLVLTYPLTGAFSQVDFNLLKPGIYFVTIRSAHATLVQKLVKQ
jgi:photosystem II stability/assembly factor-like uncharacterized protein